MVTVTHSSCIWPLAVRCINNKVTLLTHLGIPVTAEVSVCMPYGWVQPAGLIVLYLESNKFNCDSHYWSTRPTFGNRSFDIFWLCITVLTNYQVMHVTTFDVRVGNSSGRAPSHSQHSTTPHAILSLGDWSQSKEPWLSQFYLTMVAVPREHQEMDPWCRWASWAPHRL